MPSFPPPPYRPPAPFVPSGPPAAIYRPSSAPRGGGAPGARWGLRLGLVAGLLAVAAGASAGLRAYYLPSGAVVPGLAVDGERLPDGADEAAVKAVIARHAEGLAARKVALAMPGAAAPVLEATFGDLGVRVDVDATAQLAASIGKTGDLWSRVQATRESRAGKLDVPLRLTVDRPTAFAQLDSIKERTDTEAISARLDLDKHETVPEKDGRYVDEDGAVARLESGARGPANGPLRIDLPVASFAPRISAAFLKDLDITTVLAEYDTFFSRGGDQQRRGKNIDNAAQKLDGLVISPGEMVSFNTVVGERSEANGFQKSWEIFKGEMVEGVGGGTCQVASTFHAAAFFGGFDVLERLPHSRPSAYIPMGLDSTVVYPGVDLKMRNPHPFPVVVHAKTEGGKLHVELLGKTKPVTVSFGRDLESTIPYKRKVIEEPSLTGKKVVVKQHGIKGFKVKRSRLLKYADGTQRKEEATDFYPPTVEIYNVPVGFDVAQLPALPGEEDAELGGTPSATPVSARGPAAGASTAETAGLELVDAPGAHAPNASQKDPAKTMWLRH
ncbi:MAG: Vancomycin B-type resistance protein VanW [Labilithrix sp.]|nr:Vancomycin B-type resistance protein VanW [Labilithrix sp.]